MDGYWRLPWATLVDELPWLRVVQPADDSFAIVSSRVAILRVDTDYRLAYESLPLAAYSVVGKEPVEPACTRTVDESGASIDERLQRLAYIVCLEDLASRRQFRLTTGSAEEAVEVWGPGLAST